MIINYTLIGFEVRVTMKNFVFSTQNTQIQAESNSATDSTFMKWHSCVKYRFVSSLWYG